MDYFKKFCISLKEVIVIFILEYLVVLASSTICIITKNNLDNFILQYLPVIILLFNIGCIVYLYKKNKIKEDEFKKNRIFPLALFGISIAVVLNMLLFLTGNTNSDNSINIFIVILSTAIIGPIFEEILFRYVYLNKLLEFNSRQNAVMINTVIFSMMHTGINTMIYAFVMGLVLNFVYLKYKNIKASIIVHMCANLIVVFLYEFNIYMLIFSILGLIISYLIMTKKRNK